MVPGCYCTSSYCLCYSQGSYETLARPVLVSRRIIVWDRSFNTPMERRWPRPRWSAPALIPAHLIRSWLIWVGWKRKLPTGSRRDPRPAPIHMPRRKRAAARRKVFAPFHSPRRAQSRRRVVTTNHLNALKKRVYG